MRRLLPGVFSCLVLAGCTPADPEDPALSAWVEQMEAARAAREAGDTAGAQAAYEAASQLAEADGRLRMNVRSLEGLAHMAAGRGDLAGAESLFEQMLALQMDSLRTTGVPADDLLQTLGTLGDIALQRGETERAAALFDQIVSLADEGWIDLSPYRPHLSFVLAGQARVKLAQGDTLAASRLGTRASGLRQYAQGFELFVSMRYDEAEKMLQGALEFQMQQLGADHDDVANTRRALEHVRRLAAQ